MSVAWCVPCSARERIIVGGRCTVCGRRPGGSPEPTVLALAEAELDAEGYRRRSYALSRASSEPGVGMMPRS
jgi:hypothetical protein